jgi:hypothetical protein
MSKYRLSKLNFTSSHFSAFDCILNGEKAIYCSSEFTTGLRLYRELRKRGLKAEWELKRDLGEAEYKKNILGANAQSANAFAASVRHAQRDKTPVITPAPFSASGWGQREYLAFWEEVIRTRVKAVRFNRNWEFSNGCTFECWVALDAEIPTFDSNGNPLGRDAAIECVEEALEQLKEDKLDLTELQDNLQLIRSLGEPPPTNGTADTTLAQVEVVRVRL